MQLKFEYVQCFSILLPNVTRLFSPWNGPVALFMKPSINQSICTSCPPVQTLYESSVSWPHVPASDDGVDADEGETETESKDCSHRETEIAHTHCRCPYNIHVYSSKKLTTESRTSEPNGLTDETDNKTLAFLCSNALLNMSDGSIMCTLYATSRKAYT